MSFSGAMAELVEERDEPDVVDMVVDSRTTEGSGWAQMVYTQARCTEGGGVQGRGKVARG